MNIPKDTRSFQDVINEIEGKKKIKVIKVTKDNKKVTKDKKKVKKVTKDKKKVKKVTKDKKKVKKTPISKIKIRNPESGRFVLLKKFLDSNKDNYNYIDNVLYPSENNKNEYASYNGQLIRINSKWFISLGKEYQLNDNIDGSKILEHREEKTTISPFSGRKITINGDVFKKILKLGYIYNRDNNTIYAPEIIQSRKFKMVPIINDDLEEDDFQFNYQPLLNYVRQKKINILH